MKIKRVFSAFLSAAVILTSAVGTMMSVGAAGQSTELSLTVQKWDGATGSNIPAGESLEEGDVITVSMKMGTRSNPVKNIGGISADLKYDTSSFTYQDGSASCMIVDPEGKSSFRDASGTIKAFWDTTTKDLSVWGTVFSFRFVVKNVAEAKTVDFSLTLGSLFENDDKQSDISVTVKTVTQSVSVGKTEIDPSVIEAS